MQRSKTQQFWNVLRNAFDRLKVAKTTGFQLFGLTARWGLRSRQAGFEWRSFRPAEPHESYGCL